MSHCSITLNAMTCVRAENVSGDGFFLRWAFHADGSRPDLRRRPLTGFWTLQSGRAQTIADTVVNQSIFDNEVYVLDLELWGDGVDKSLSTRLSARMTYIMGGWGWKAAIPGAGIVAFFAALLGAGRNEVFMARVSLPVQVVVIPEVVGIGLGSVTHALSGHVGQSHAIILYTVVLS